MRIMSRLPIEGPWMNKSLISYSSGFGVLFIIMIFRLLYLLLSFFREQAVEFYSRLNKSPPCSSIISKAIPPP